MTRRRLIALCLLIFFYTLLTRLPVAFLYGRLSPPSSPIELLGIEGNLGSGSASGLLIRGQTAVRDLHWTLRPLQLLLGRAAFRVDGHGDGLVVDGKASVSVAKTVRLHDLRASGSIKPLLAAFKLYLPIEGTLGLDISDLKLIEGLPTQAQAHLELGALTWKLGRGPIVLGDFVADVAPTDQGLGAIIKSVKGPLEVSGDAQLRTDRAYEMHLQIRARSEAPPALVNMLGSLGATDNQGYYHIRRSGKLAAPAVEAVQKVSQ